EEAGLPALQGPHEFQALTLLEPGPGRLPVPPQKGSHAEKAPALADETQPLALERIEVSLAKGLQPIAVATPEELAHAGRPMGLHKGDRAADPLGQRLQLLGYPPGVIESAEPDQ